MRNRWLGFVIAAVALAVSVWACPRLPARVPTHWEVHGVPDGYSSRLAAALIVPAIVVAMNGLFRILPRLDPRRGNYEKFQDTYWLIANAVALFLLGTHVLVMVNGLGYPVAMSRLMPVGVGLLFIVLGNSLARLQPTWFVGIRTPWTLSSDTVWRKTHRTGGFLMVLGGFVVAACAFLPHGAFLPLFITAILIMAVIPIVQSYVLWKREQGKP